MARKKAKPSDMLQVDACAAVSGDAMAPELLPGDLVFIQYGTPSDGQIALVEVEGEHTLRRIHYSPDGLQLLCDKPAYPPITIDRAEDIRIIGIMAGLVRLIKENAPADLDHQQAHRSSMNSSMNTIPKFN